MTRNMGRLDRLIRGLLVVPMASILVAVVGIGSVAGVLLVVVAVVMGGTVLFGVCPLYKLAGLSTGRRPITPR